MFFYTCQQWLHVCVIIQQPLFLRGLPAVLWSRRKRREAHESPVQSWEEGFVP